MADNGDVYVIDIQAKLTNQIKDGVNDAEKDADRLSKTIERTQKQFEKLSSLEADVTISADDKATAGINRAKKAAEIFGRATVRTVIDADDRASKKIQEADKQSSKLSGKEASIMLTAQDKANEVMSKAEAKAKQLSDKAVKMVMEAKDQASPTIEKVNKKANALTKKADRIMLRAEDKASSIIDKARSKAEQFGSLSPKTTIEAIDRATHTIGNVLGTAKSFGGKVFKATLSIIDNATKPLQWIKNQIFSIQGLITGLATGVAAKQLVIDPISLADQMETASIGFETMFGDAAKAENMMNKIKDFAAKTPFDTSGVISSVQQMMRAGWTEDTVMQDMEKIGNAAAAAGQGTEGVQGIVLALQQMRMAGKLNAQDMMQLTNRGVKAWDYVAKAIGTTIPEARALSEKGLIPVDTAIQGIIDGMGEYDGMMDKMSNRTVSGLMSNLRDTFDIKIVEKWGKGLQKGATAGLSKFADYLDEIDPLLEKAGTSLEEMGEAISNWAFDKLENAGKLFKEAVSSDEFKNAQGFDKVKIVWNKVIGDPISDWWNKKGEKQVAGLASKIGKGMGEALKGGLLALLGVDIEGAGSDGYDIGASFAKGFLDGFDPETVWKAIKKAFGNSASSAAKVLPGGEKPTAGSWLNAGLLAYGASKLGLGKVAGWGLKGIGKLIANYGVAGGTKLTLGSLIGSAAGGTGLMGLFANAGTALGATGSAAGAAALGGSSILGGIFGGLGLINGGWDLYKGFAADNEEEKEKRLWRGGTKIGMVGGGAAAGAGVGAAIGALFGGVGAVPGALIGAGIGGIGALFGGNAAGDWLREKKNLGKEVLDNSNMVEKYNLPNNAFTQTVAGMGYETTKKAVNFALDKNWISEDDLKAASNFLNETLPNAVSSFTDKAGTFFTETIPTKWNEFWGGIGSFFTETIPNAVSDFGDKVGEFFTETIPEKWNEFWDGVDEFFTETVPYAFGYAASRVHTFFTVTVPEKFGELWDTVSEFFTETVPEAAEFVWEKVSTFFTETVPEKFGELWDTVSGFFTETIPEAAANIWENVTTFFMVTIPGKIAELWDSATEFVTETLIPALETIGNAVNTFFTETIPGKIAEIWDGAVEFVTKDLATGLETIGKSISTFFTVTVPGWFSGLWDSAVEKWNSFKSNFSLGWSDGKEDGSKGGKAHGGVVQSKMLSWLGEEGPEAVIPLNPSRRDRALSLWMQTGQRLGVSAHANGGIVGDGAANGSNILYTPYYKPAEAVSSDDSAGGNRYTGLIDGSVREAITARVSDTGSGYSVQVTIQGINFNVNAGSADPEAIIATIRANSDEFTDMMADMLESALREAFQNIPKAS